MEVIRDILISKSIERTLLNNNDLVDIVDYLIDFYDVKNYIFSVNYYHTEPFDDGISYDRGTRRLFINLNLLTEHAFRTIKQSCVSCHQKIDVLYNMFMIREILTEFECISQTKKHDLEEVNDNELMLIDSDIKFRERRFDAYLKFDNISVVKNMAKIDSANKLLDLHDLRFNGENDELSKLAYDTPLRLYRSTLKNIKMFSPLSKYIYLAGAVEYKSVPGYFDNRLQFWYNSRKLSVEERLRYGFPFWYTNENGFLESVQKRRKV